MEKPVITQMPGRAGQFGVRVVLAMVSCIMLAAGCNSLAHPRDLRAASITLKRTLCEGTCPAYSVTIDGSGLVQYVDHLASGQDNTAVPDRTVLL
jgi:hypothetical protein